MANVMKKYCNTAVAFLCLICFCSCKPSPRMEEGQRQKDTASRENMLSPQIIEKIQKIYREETGYTIKVIKVHEVTTFPGGEHFIKIIIEREGRRFLTAVEIENIDGVQVIKILYFMEKEIK